MFLKNFIDRKVRFIGWKLGIRILVIFMFFLKLGEINIELFNWRMKMGFYFFLVRILLIFLLSFIIKCLGKVFLERKELVNLLLVRGKNCLFKINLFFWSLYVCVNEIKKVVFVMNDIKFFGFDGYGSGFFKVGWFIIGDDVIFKIVGFYLDMCGVNCLL